jgi:hypothetical protein
MGRTATVAQDRAGPGFLLFAFSAILPPTSNWAGLALTKQGTHSMRGPDAGPPSDGHEWGRSGGKHHRRWFIHGAQLLQVVCLL